MTNDAPTLWRDPTDREQYVDFFAYVSRLDQAKQAYSAVVGEVGRKMAKDLAQDAATLIRAKNIAGLSTLKAGHVGEMAEAMMKVIRPVIAYGHQTVLEEKKRFLDGTPVARMRDERLKLNVQNVTPQEVESYSQAKASHVAQNVAGALERRMQDEALRLVRIRIKRFDVLEEDLEAVATSAVDKGIMSSGHGMVAEAFGLGRGSEIYTQTTITGISVGVYSALLDGNACGLCAQLDGSEFLPGTPDFQSYMFGNPECLGADMCRCLLFLEYGDMQQPVVQDWAPGMDPDIVRPGYNPIGRTPGNPLQPYWSESSARSFAGKLKPTAPWAEREASRLLSAETSTADRERIASLLSQHPEKIVKKIESISLQETDKAMQQALADAGFSKEFSKNVVALWNRELSRMTLGPGFDDVTFHHEMGHAFDQFAAKVKMANYRSAWQINPSFDRHTDYAKTSYEESFAESYAAFIAFGSPTKKVADAAYERTFSVLRKVLGL